ncbi:MAG: hypothetical protein GYA02_16105 [Clostridiaceae bacterium]|nr:hypothetical protein [Clostridiaceae bacterium]
MKNLINWIKKNIPEYEIHDKTGGGKIVFIPAKHDSRIRQYIKRTKQPLTIQYRANYTWLAIYK